METAVKIVVVEDDLIVGEDLSGLLTGFGYHVQGLAADGDEALGILAQEEPSLVLLDITLAGKSTGIDVAHYLNSNSVPFIFLTAHSDAKTLQAAVKTNPYGYLAKPFSANELKPAIELALYKHRSQQLEKQLHEQEKQLAALQLQTAKKALKVSSEELFEREKEKNKLLEISTAISQIANREGLLTLIEKTLQPLFGFVDTSLFIIDNDWQHYRMWFDTLQVPYVEGQRPEGIPMGNPVIDHCLEDKPPRIITRQAMLEKAVSMPAVTEWIEKSGTQGSLVGVLKVGGRVIGCFISHYRSLNAFNERLLPLYQSVCEHVAIAVANILANEEILEQEKQKSQLLEISTAISQIANRSNLLETIVQKIQPIFGFADTALFIVDPDWQHYRLWFDTLQEPYIEGAKSVTGPGIPMGNPVIDSCLKDIPPRVVLKDEMLDLAASMPSLTEWIIESGTQEVLVGTLKVGGKVIGCMNLHSKVKGTFVESMLPLYQHVCEQVSIAVANILANEEILEREREKSVLLKISNQLSLVNDRKELWAMVSKTLKELINFNVGVVATLDPDGKSFRILLSTAPRDMDNNPEYRELGTKPEILAGSPFEYIFKKEGVFEFNLTELEGMYPGYLGLKMMREYGLLHTVGIKLCKGDEYIGQMYLHFAKQEDIDKTKFGLLKGIGEQLSIVVTNILANEQIQERAKEKSLQIEVVNAITATNNKKEAFLNLANVINTVIPFHTFSIAFPFDINYLIGFKKNKEGTLVEWNNVEEIMAYAGIDITEYQHLLNDITASGYFSKAHICVGQDHEEQCRNFKISALHNACIGTRSALHLPFLFHGQNLPVHIYLNSQDAYGFTEKDLNLLQLMVSPLSLAMENLFAFEDIEKREREKALLLSLSEDMATIRDQNDLFRVVTDKIKPLIQFDDAVVFIADANRDRYYLLFFNNELPNRTENSFFNELIFSDLRLSGSVEEWIISHKEPLIISTDQFVERYPEAPGIRLMQAVGIQDSLVGVLRNGGTTLGSLHLHSETANFFKPAQLPLFKSILDQVAVAVANILANEEILVREQEKSILLSFSKDIATVKNKLDLWRVIMGKIRARVGFEDAVIIVYSSDKKQVFHFLTMSNEHRQHNEHYSTLTTKWLDVNDTPFEWALNQPESYTFSTPFLGELYPSYPGIQIMKETGLGFTVANKIMSRGNEFGVLNLHFKDEKQANTARLDFYKSIADQVALAVANILAYEEIERQLTQITDLKKQLDLENSYLREEVRTLHNFGEIIGSAESLMDAIEKTHIVAPTDATVLILGETGTGKELIARAIHNHSPRHKKTLIKINCAALPPQLIESELFGHERGAFTGAIDRRIGKFELAHDSTLFLDEIGELPLELQAKLLRAIQEKEIERLGSNKPFTVNVRIVAATNRDLFQEVQAGRFRADLFYRLNVFPITLPPLRERREDIPALAQYFIEKFAKKLGKDIYGISATTLAELQAYSFPGNIRELEHILERSCLLAKRKLIQEIYLPKTNKPQPSGKQVVRSIDEIERDHILDVLARCGGRVSGPGGAADLLGIPNTTLTSKMKRLGIVRQHKSTR